MSMVQQLIAAINAAEVQVDRQMAQLNVYIGELDQAASRIQNALSGSSQPYGQEMLQQLSVTREDVNRSLARLQQAKQSLGVVKMM